MPRSAIPSRAQVEMLVESLEERRWLATGHSRTSHARDRTRAAWQEVAGKLNSDGSGCIKSWQQWSKYWKDKKSAVANEPGPSFNLTPDVPNAEVSDDMLLSIQDVTEEANATPGSESILQSHVQLPVEHSTRGMLQTEQSTPSIPDVQPGPSWHRDNMPMENQPSTEQMFEARSPPAVPHRSNAPIASSSPRRRRTARRRLIQRSPPSQRRSQMASLTERFIVIEERRVENERLLIETFKEISESWSRQTQALQDLCASIRRGN